MFFIDILLREDEEWLAVRQYNVILNVKEMGLISISIPLVTWIEEVRQQWN